MVHTIFCPRRMTIRRTVCPQDFAMSARPSSPSVLAQFIERARNLYSLPAVAMRVLDLTSQPKVDVRALKECIENDPALTMKILRVVNSSLFGLTREVTDLNQALALLGTKPLKMLVLGFSLPRNLFTALEADVLSQYWRHTLTKAVVARELAQRLWHVSGEEAFIAALLQEIGQLVLIQDLGEPYVKFASRVYASGQDLLTFELETLGFDHAVLSARLLDHWGLPESIVHAVGMPHDCARILALPPPEQMLPQILHLSELLARMLDQDGNQILPELLEVGRQYRRLTLEDLPLLLCDLEDKVQQLAEVLQLHLAQHEDFRDVLSDAQQQLAQVAEEAARELTETSNAWQETLALSQAIADYAQTPTKPAPHKLDTEPIKAFSTATRVATLDATATATQPRQAVVAKDVSVWTDPGLMGRVATAMVNCRQARQPLSLALVEVDHYSDWVLAHGREGTHKLMLWLAEQLGAVTDRAQDLQQLGDGQFAMLLSDCDRPQAIELTREALGHVREWSEQRHEQLGRSLSLSVGLASLVIPPKNFPPQELIGAAKRCLQGAQLSGGDTLKSIEMV